MPAAVANTHAVAVSDSPPRKLPTPCQAGTRLRTASCRILPVLHSFLPSAALQSHLQQNCPLSKNLKAMLNTTVTMCIILINKYSKKTFLQHKKHNTNQKVWDIINCTADWQKYRLLIDFCAVSFTGCAFSSVNSKSLNEGFVNVWKHVCRFN